MDNTIRQWECFPWSESDYSNYEGATLQDRVRTFAAQYWRKRIASETAASTSGRHVFNPTFDHEFPERDEALSPGLVDLTAWFNGKLDAMWLPVRLSRESRKALNMLPQGAVWLAGVRFDARGVVQLANNDKWSFQKFFPNRVDGIQVNQKARHLHFLHACDGWDRDGTQVGTYVIHYLDGSTDELKIIYGQDTGNWWSGGTVVQAEHSETRRAYDAVIAWQGTHDQSQTQSPAKRLRLSRKTYENPQPKKIIQRIDFVSSLKQSAPFLVALTVTDEPATMITAQPDSTRAIIGGTASFSVDAEGESPLTHQWYHDGAPIQGATNAVLRLRNIASTDFGYYQVSVDHSGAESLLREMSDRAHLEVARRLPGDPESEDGDLPKYGDNLTLPNPWLPPGAKR